MINVSPKLGYTIQEVLKYNTESGDQVVTLFTYAAVRNKKKAYNSIWVEVKTNSEVTIENFQYSIIVSPLQEI